MKGYGVPNVTGKLKVVKGSWISDVIKRDWKERLLQSPWRPLVKFRVNNNAYYDQKTNTYYVSPNTFKKISGKTNGHNVKFCSQEALESVCG